MRREFVAVDPAPWGLPPELEAELFSPSLIVYLDRVRANLRAVLALAGGPSGDLAAGAERWRPHVKTAKIPRVMAEYARLGVRNFKCATTREARVLAAALRAEGVAAADLLLAYPLIGPALRELGALARESPELRVSVLCEDASAVAAIPSDVSVFVDVNPEMNRTGIPLDEPEAILAVARAAGARFRGVHYYDGHLHEGAWDERRRAADRCYGLLMELLARFAQASLPVEEVVTSGTPSFQHALAFPGFAELGDTRHRVSPGTVVYHDWRSAQLCERLDLEPAALVFTRVVSHPRADLATCDAGSKAVAAEAGDPCAAVLGHPELVAQTPNEEHLPLRVTSGARPERGEGLLLFPLHVCPTVNLAEEAVLMDGGRCVGIVPVSARAHDVRPSGS